MRSKTGWTMDRDEDLFCGVWGLVDAKDDAFNRRVCVRVDECPETIKRSELQTTLDVGWWFQDPRGKEFLVVDFVGSGIGVIDDEHREWQWHSITAVRPHSEAPWITVED